MVMQAPNLACIRILSWDHIFKPTEKLKMPFMFQDGLQLNSQTGIFDTKCDILYYTVRQTSCFILVKYSRWCLHPLRLEKALKTVRNIRLNKRLSVHLPRTKTIL